MLDVIIKLHHPPEAKVDIMHHMHPCQKKNKKYDLTRRQATE